jgi:hypothetical protein
MSLAAFLTSQARPHNPDYSVLKQARRAALRAWAKSSHEWIGLSALYKLPERRPPREFYGVREGTSSAPTIAATAKVRGPSPNKGRKETPERNKASKLIMEAFGALKIIFIGEDDEECEHPLCCPGASLGGKKPEPS